MSSRTPDAILKPIAERLLVAVTPTEDTKFLARQTEWWCVIVNQVGEAAHRGIALPADLANELYRRFPGFMARVPNLHTVSQETRQRELVPA